jgi:hypothetical protein
LESNRKFFAIFRRQVRKSCRETAGRLFIEDGVVVISNESRLCVFNSTGRSATSSFFASAFFDRLSRASANTRSAPISSSGNCSWQCWLKHSRASGSASCAWPSSIASRARASRVFSVARNDEIHTLARLRNRVINGHTRVTRNQFFI